jgi:hypothetical protein
MTIHGTNNHYKTSLNKYEIRFYKQHQKEPGGPGVNPEKRINLGAIPSGIDCLVYAVLSVTPGQSRRGSLFIYHSSSMTI